MCLYPNLEKVSFVNHSGHITAEHELKVEGIASGRKARVRNAIAETDLDWNRDTSVTKTLYFIYKADEMIVTASVLQGAYIQKIQTMYSHLDS